MNALRRRRFVLNVARAPPFFNTAFNLRLTCKTPMPNPHTPRRVWIRHRRLAGQTQIKSSIEKWWCSCYIKYEPTTPQGVHIGELRYRVQGWLGRNPPARFFNELLFFLFQQSHFYHLSEPQNIFIRIIFADLHLPYFQPHWEG